MLVAEFADNEEFLYQQIIDPLCNLKKILSKFAEKSSIFSTMIIKRKKNSTTRGKEEDRGKGDRGKEPV